MTQTVSIIITGSKAPPPPAGQITVAVIDIVTRKPIANATLTSGANQSTTDATGTATITLATGYGINISASGYLSKNITPLTSTIQVSLIPIWLIGAGVGGALLIIGVIAAVSSSKGGSKR